MAVDPRWTLLPTPEPIGIFHTLKATFRAYDVGDDQCFLAQTDHGVDINPGMPKVPGDGPLRGPYKTLLFVTLDVHCTLTDEYKTFPFKFGHTSRLTAEDIPTWMRHCLTNLLTHEVFEAVP